MSDKFEKPLFEPVFNDLTEAEYEEAAKKHAIRRRSSLAILTKSSDELMEIAKKCPDTLMDIHDEINIGKKAYSSLADLMDSASMRILTTCGYAHQEGIIDPD